MTAQPRKHWLRAMMTYREIEQTAVAQIVEMQARGEDIDEATLIVGHEEWHEVLSHCRGFSAFANHPVIAGGVKVFRASERNHFRLVLTAK